MPTRVANDRQLETIALLDLGSHAARFLLVRIRHGKGFRVLDEERAQTRLGSGRARALSSRAVHQTLGAAREFVAHAAARGATRVVVIATAAVREASNGAHLLAPLRQVEGTEVRVLSWHEEARLGARAALGWRALRQGTVIDLGGGSLQVTRVEDGHVLPLVSAPLGVVRTTGRFIRHDPPTEAEIARLQREVIGELKTTLTSCPAPLVGLGGTIRALGRIRAAAEGRPGRRERLSLGELTSLRQALARSPLHERQRLRGLKADRADVIVAGAVVLETLMVLGGYPALHVCPRGVCHGVLLDLTFGTESGA